MSGVLINPTLFEDVGGLIERNLVTDHATSLLNWNQWLSAQPRANTYRLTIPAGSYVFLDNNPGAGGGGATLAFANRHVLITGDTAANTIMQIGGLAGGAPFSLGFYSDATSINPQPRFASADVGDTTVTLNDPARADDIVVNNWICVSAWALQNAGYPPNLHFFEFRRVLSKNNITGVVTFDEGLDYSYSDTYPEFETYDPTFQPDRGGAACVFPFANGDCRGQPFMMAIPDATNNFWDMDLEIRNLSLTGETVGSQFYGSCKTILLEDCIITGALSPNSAKTYTLRRCTMPNVQMEVDKQIEHLVFDDCVMRGILFQSSSTNLWEATDCDFTPLGNFGIAKNTIYTRCTGPGFGGMQPAYFGQAETLTLIDCNFASWANPGGNAIRSAVATMEAGGVIRFTRDAWENYEFGDIMSRAVPGACHAVRMTAAPYSMFYAFKILDVVAEDGALPPPYDNLRGDVLLYTTIDDALYTTIFAVAGGWNTSVYGPQLTVSNCVGTPQARSASRGHPPGGRPWIYSNSGVYDGTDGHGSPAVNEVISCDYNSLNGQFVSMTISVTQAYTGAVSTDGFLRLFGAFANEASIIHADGTRVEWNAFIDMTQTGTRVITPGSITGAVGGDVIDSVTASQMAWFWAQTPDLFVRTPGGNRADLNSVPAGQRINVQVTIVVDPMLD